MRVRRVVIVGNRGNSYSVFMWINWYSNCSSPDSDPENPLKRRSNPRSRHLFMDERQKESY